MSWNPSLSCLIFQPYYRSPHDGDGVGTRVVRGPDWKWSDQDDGEGHLGTVVTIERGSRTQHIRRSWWSADMGKSADYRAGFDENYDLLIYDNAAAGETVINYSIAKDKKKST